MSISTQKLLIRRYDAALRLFNRWGGSHDPAIRRHVRRQLSQAQRLVEVMFNNF